MKNLKLRTKLLIIILVAVIPLVTLHSFIIRYQYRQAVDGELKASQEYAEAVGVAYMNYVNKVWYSEYLIGITVMRDSFDNHYDLQFYLEECAFNDPAVRSYSWINPKGVIISSGSKDAIGIDISDREYIKAIINGQENVVSDLVVGKASKIPTLAIVKGIRKDGELKGIVSAAIDINKLEAVLPDNRLGQTSSFGLFDRNGMIVYRNGTPDIPVEKRRIKDDSPAWKALRGEIGIADSYNASIDGISLIGANVPVPAIGWGAFATTMTQEVLEKPNSEALSSVIIMLLIIIVSLTIAMYIILDLLKPIRVLGNTANAIAHRDFSVRTNLQRKDELGQTAAAFDKMAERIQELEDSRMLFLQSAAHELRNPNFSVTGTGKLAYLFTGNF